MNKGYFLIKQQKDLFLEASKICESFKKDSRELLCNPNFAIDEIADFIKQCLLRLPAQISNMSDIEKLKKVVRHINKEYNSTSLFDLTPQAVYDPVFNLPHYDPKIIAQYEQEKDRYLNIDVFLCFKAEATKTLLSLVMSLFPLCDIFGTFTKLYSIFVHAFSNLLKVLVKLFTIQTVISSLLSMFYICRMYPPTRQIQLITITKHLNSL